MRRPSLSRSSFLSVLALAAAASSAGFACSSSSTGATGGAGGESATSTASHTTTSTASHTTSTAAGGGGTVDVGASVLTFHNDAARTGLYVDAAITKAAAAGVHVDPTFHATLNGNVYAQVLYVDARGTGPDVIVAVTESDFVHALSAADGSELWHTSLGASVQPQELDCGNISPYGATGTPVVDYASRTLYVAAVVSVNGAASQQIFALSLDTGAVLPGWPVVVESAVAATPGAPFDTRTQGQRSALLIVKGTLYVAYGGMYGDCNPYRGWVVGVSETDPTAVTAWSTAHMGGGTWTPGGPSFDGASIYVATGNTFGANGSWGGGDAIIELPLSLHFANRFYAPANWQSLDDSDLDLGSNVLPINLGGASLAAVFGKDGNLYVADRANLPGVGGELYTAHVASGEIIGAPTFFQSGGVAHVAVKGSGVGCGSGQPGNLIGITLSASGATVPWCADGGGTGSPITTSPDGASDFVVWDVGADGDGRLHGYDALTGAEVFAGGGSGDRMNGLRRYASPIVAKGRIFMGADGSVYAFTP
ncbi:MAG TPA: hypothetical protein VGM56_29240 [Byssovorax sp.]|jgi:hypothetical protein